MANFKSKKLLAAKVLSRKDWEKPADIALARRMAHEGGTLKEIMAALGWDCILNTARERLKKYNIHPHNWANRAHRGHETGLPECQIAEDMSNYRPLDMSPAAVRRREGAALYRLKRRQAKACSSPADAS